MRQKLTNGTTEHVYGVTNFTKLCQNNNPSIWWNSGFVPNSCSLLMPVLFHLSSRTGRPCVDTIHHPRFAASAEMWEPRWRGSTTNMRNSSKYAFLAFFSSTTLLWKVSRPSSIPTLSPADTVQYLNAWSCYSNTTHWFFLSFYWSSQLWWCLRWNLCILVCWMSRGSGRRL